MSDACADGLSSALKLNTSSQEFTEAVTEPCLEAQRENTVMIESEKEHIQQVQNNLMTVTEKCLKDFEQKRTFMCKSDYINQKLLSHFLKIVKEDLKGLNIDAASFKS